MIMFALVLLGLCFGSFVNALVWRMHEQTKSKTKRKAGNLSILRGRSMCVHCGHELATKDLLPVLSWLSLGGKCRYCKKPISRQYPVVELTAAVLFVVAYLFWPYYWQISSNPYTQINYVHVAFFVSFLAAVVVGLALAVYDFKWMILPNRLVAVLGSLGLLYAASQLLSSTGSWSFFGVVLAVMVAGGIFWVLFQISGGKWIGGGDVKLGLALGLFLGKPDSAVLMLFTASLLGTLYVGLLVLVRKYKKGIHVPFGPFLLLGTYLVVLFEAPVVNYYMNLFLI